MKKLLLLILMFQCCFFYGQQEGEKPKPIKFSSSDRSGIIYYEVDEVTENIRVKKDGDLFYDVAKAIRKYNNQVKEVAFLNSKNFKELDVMINGALNSDAPRETDPAILKKKKEESEHLLSVIPDAAKKMISFNKILNEKLKKILSEKQYKKWIKYKKKKIKTLIPERPAAPDNGRTSRSGFGNGGLNQRQQGGGFR